jgi:hypothetical protein
MEPWYRVTTPRPEVREGRSFNPDEFAIALEQVAFQSSCDGIFLTQHVVAGVIAVEIAENWQPARY